ncbi:MAG TPA: BatA domain-containing protein [Myxococcaceae bacterium]|nr:BatA domain-containing protein [Myxococcaceae bacterium]
MSFANSWALWGCLAALLPILIHLFDRRRARPLPFAAITFVLQSQRRTASRLRLKRILLYTLRTLVFLCVPLALARPSCTPESAAAAQTRGPAATAIVLDTSLSMRTRADGTPIFEAAIEEARRALADLRPEEPATLVTCGGQEALPGPPDFDRAGMRTRLDGLEEAGYLHADLNRCLDAAARALEESPLPGRRLVVISDFAAHGLRLEAPPPVVSDGEGGHIQPEVVLRPVGSDPAPGNAAVTRVQVAPATQAGPGTFELTATVRNASPEALSDTELSLQIDGHVVAKAFLDVPAGGTVNKALVHRFEQTGVVSGALALSADALPEDDAHPFVLRVPEPVRVLVINGAPAAQRFADELFFLEPALTTQGGPVRATFRDSFAGLSEQLGEVDVVVLANVAAPDAGTVETLRTFVEGGGGLWITMGDQVDPEAYNAAFGSLLPRNLRDVRTAAERGDQDAEARAGRLTQLDREHPLLRPFVGRAAEGLETARFYRYMLFEGGVEGSRVLAAFQDGAPALVVGRRGEGRVALYASTVDRDWADLALSTAFLPLVQRLSAYLGGDLDTREAPSVQVGERLTLAVPEGQRVGTVEGPMADVPVRATEEARVEVGPLTVPGLYGVKDGDGQALPALSFSAFLGSEESDLRRVPLEDLQRWFGEEKVTTSGLDTPAREVPVWTWLLVIAALALFGEGLLLRR